MLFDHAGDKNKIKQMKALNLAYVGDAVYELYIRSNIINKHPEAKVRALHMLGSSVSNCTFQAGLLEKLKPLLSDDEAAVVRRGENAKPHSSPRNASKPLYIEATAFEALLGYVYLSGDETRLTSILEAIEKEIEKMIV